MRSVRKTFLLRDIFGRALALVNILVMCEPYFRWRNKLKIMSHHKIKTNAIFLHISRYQWNTFPQSTTVCMRLYNSTSLYIDYYMSNSSRFELAKVWFTRVCLVIICIHSRHLCDDTLIRLLHELYAQFGIPYDHLIIMK